MSANAPPLFPGSGGLRYLFPDTTAARLRRALGDWQGDAVFAEDEQAIMGPDQIVSLAESHGVDVLMVRTWTVRVDRRMIERLPPTVRLINVQATGIDNVDLDAAAERGLAVTNLPVASYAVDEAAEFALALIFSAAKRLRENDANLRAGRWRGAPAEPRMMSLRDRTLGIVGYGAVGQRLAGLVRGLGWRVVVHTRRPRASEAGEPAVSFVPLPELLGCSDFVVFCVPLTPDTRYLLNAANAALLRPGAVVVNISRGEVVDEVAIAAAARDGRLCYCADVFSAEPPAGDNPLLQAANTLLTPHVAWKTEETLRAAFELWVRNATEFFAGRPIHLVLPSGLSAQGPTTTHFR